MLTADSNFSYQSLVSQLHEDLESSDDLLVSLSENLTSLFVEQSGFGLKLGIMENIDGVVDSSEIIWAGGDELDVVEI